MSQVIVALAGGLGNQLFQISAAISIRGIREILLDSSLGDPRLNPQGLPEVHSFRLPKYFRRTETKKNHEFCRRVYRLTLKIGLRKAGKPFRWWENLLIFFAQTVLSFHFKTNLKIVCNRGVGYSPIHDCKETQLLIGYFQSYKYSDPRVMQEIDQFKFENGSSRFVQTLARAESLKPIILHVRLADYLHEPKIGVLSKRYFEEALKLISSRESRTIWIFSDSPNMVRNEMFVSNAINAEVFGSDDFSTAETFELMQKAEYLVISNSTYSWWAARISESSKKMIIAPEPWFSGQESPIDLIPDGWELRRR
jgi:hypothetical protein